MIGTKGIKTMGCKICGGDMGGFSPEGNHYLCQERAKRNLPTPCLGKRCLCCNGTGHKGHSKIGPMLFLDIGPAAIKRSIEAIFPICQECQGKGYA